MASRCEEIGFAMKENTIRVLCNPVAMLNDVKEIE